MAREREGLMERKAFPESYDLSALLRFLSDVRRAAFSASSNVFAASSNVLANSIDLASEGDTVASGDASKAQENRAKYLKPLGRLAKYLALVIMVLILVRLVFDCYSFYIARRDIDAELQSKRVSSLEYLNLLSQRARALALSTLEARCLERAQLTLFRNPLGADTTYVLDRKCFSCSGWCTERTGSMNCSDASIAHCIDPTTTPFVRNCSASDPQSTNTQLHV
jgi:hypothetical protein